MNFSASTIDSNRHDGVLMLISAFLVLGFVVFTIDQELQYGFYEWTSSQFLNAIHYYQLYGPSALSYKASLMGGVNPDAHSYGNMPTYHFLLSYLLIKYGVITYSYFQLQFVTVAIFTALILFSTKYVHNITGSRNTAILYLVAILVNTGISYTYKDLWWESYTLFFSYVPLLYLLSRTDGRIIPLVLGAVQFIAVFDAVLFVAVSYIALSWRQERRIGRSALYYALGSVIGVVILFAFRAGTGQGNVSGGLLLQNIIEIDKSDLFRFIYFYFADPQVVIVWVFVILTAIATKDMLFPASIVAASLVWTIVFPAHGLHHAYHYSAVMVFGLTMYIFLAKHKRQNIKYIVVLLYILTAGFASVSLNNDSYKVDYASYKDVSLYVDESSIVGTNIYSYPFSYYANRAFKYVTADAIDAQSNSVLVVDDFKQAEKGVFLVYSRIKLMLDMLGVEVPEYLSNTYHGREKKFKQGVEELKYKLLENGYHVVWENKSFDAVLYGH
ncbi:hypothetical protein MNBD_GAMMA08-555 [hydrothermal vent metagenome]|uniref:Uncharacterized protein n=1 Tax=hydrothermal vent metagenome TaxID=652676 RepID=A0A3B0X9Q1_9ZZZZ